MVEVVVSRASQASEKSCKLLASAGSFFPFSSGKTSALLQYPVLDDFWIRQVRTADIRFVLASLGRTVHQ